VDDAGATLTGGTPSLSEPRTSAALAAAVGLAPDDLTGVPAHMAGCGLPFTYLAVRPDAVDHAAPERAALDALGVGEGVSVLSWDEASATAYARVFAGDLHWDEDPATGSAALGTGVWLVATGLLPGEGTSSYRIRQGEKMGRPSDLFCTVTAAGGLAVSATVRGEVVPIASGRIRVPS
jgi:trans-2,3-dihydro-3-hydroxyanthranilate isomerase